VGYVSTTFGKKDYAAINKDISAVVKIVVIIAFCLFLFAYLFYAIWQQSAEKVTMKLKVMYLKALLQQEPEYFEKVKVEEIPAQVADIFS